MLRFFSGSFKYNGITMSVRSF